MMNKEFYSSSKDRGPVFIVGMNGSGTTMLLDCLANHPDLYAFPRETRIFPFFISKLSSYGDLTKLSARKKLALDLGKSFPFWQENNKKPVVLNDNKLKSFGFSGVVDSIMQHFYTSKSSSIFWVEKSPMYVQHINLLATYFPNARFIHIYRDGRDIAQSLHRRWKRDPRWTIYRWKNIVQIGRFQGNQLKGTQYFEVRYEDLTSYPKLYMEKISNFLCIKYNQLLLKSSMREMDPNIRSNHIVSNHEKWRAYFSVKQIYQMELIAGNVLSDLGYTITTADGYKNPSKLYLMFWRLCDYLRSSIKNYEKFGVGSTPTFLRKVQSALRQRKTNYF